MQLKDHLEKLRYFISAYESGSFKKAAENVFISQPQITRTIKQLEQILDKKLFLRNQKGVTPTLDGDKLYKFSKDLFSKTDEFEFSIRSNSSRMKGVIHIGTYDSISRYFFPNFIKYMKNLMPELTIILSTGRSKKILKGLENNDLDIAIIVGKWPKKSLQFQSIYNDSFKLYQSKQMEQSFQNILIAFEDSVKEFDALNFDKIEHIYNCENLETVMSLTMEGLGVGLLPTKVAHDNIITGKLVESPFNIEENFSNHSIFMASKKNENKKTVNIISEELIRFLDVWSRR